jgi:F0F1-type ATP synthase membrane subunit b/b'
MKTEKAIQVLRDYNLWRRGNEDMEQPDPHTVGEAIDDVLMAIQKAEAELDEERKEGEEQARLLGMGSEREAKLIAERDLWRETAEESFQTRAWKQLIEEEKVRMKRRLEYMVGDDWGNKLPKPK